MPLRVAYIPYSHGDADGARWGEEIMIKNLIANTRKGFKIFPVYGMSAALYTNPDLICHHNLANTAFQRRRWVRGGARLEKLLGRPISSFYDSDQEYYFNLKRRPKLMGGIRGYNGLLKGYKILKYFDAIHVNNSDLRDKVLERGARQAHVLYPGVDMALFKPMPELRPDTFTVGWAGDITKRVKNAHLIERLGYPFKMATKSNFIPHDEMPGFYNGLDVYLHFSSNEGWGRTIIEAMACGLPIVSSDAGASVLLDPEWVVKGDPRDEGWIARFHNKVEALRNDPELRRSVGLQNLVSVAPFDWSMIAIDFENICKRVIYGD